jgi:hypothetical protein
MFNRSEKESGRGTDPGGARFLTTFRGERETLHWPTLSKAVQ